MKLQKINDLIHHFKKYLQEQRDFRAAYKWECLQNFQQHWDLEAANLSEMYDQSLQSSISRSLWNAKNYSPKQQMLRFIKMDTDLVRHMFNDLFDESKSIDGRISRFVFYCDQLLEEYKRLHPTSIENNHDHGDYRMVSLYLGFRYPEQYTLYSFDDFCAFLKIVESAKIPATHDMDRFFKLSRTVGEMLKKDTAFSEIAEKMIRGNIFYRSPSLLWVHYLFESCRNPDFIKYL